MGRWKPEDKDRIGIQRLMTGMKLIDFIADAEEAAKLEVLSMFQEMWNSEFRPDIKLDMLYEFTLTIREKENADD